jgi:LmbE family N-acetylglucosaminyl deacetylase
MKKTNQTLPILMGILLVSMLFGCRREEVAQYAPIENFPNDSVLQSITNKKAMIVLAHDDDMCAMTGTISALNKNGWEIRVISMPKGKSRNEAHQKACKNLLDSVMFFDITEDEFRLDTVEIKYDAVPKEKFNDMFNRSLVKQKLMEQVNQFNPSVIFTLDNEMGGYGHPEHVFISQLVLDLAQADSLSTQYVYQSVYTDHMESTIMERHSKRMKSWGFPGDGWDKAKQAYKVQGMPEPSVQINIRDEAQAKMEYLKSYNERERKTIGFFVPAFEDYPAEEYFKIFDREFYRVIKIN